MTQEEKRIKLAEAGGWKPDKRGFGWLSPHGYYDTPPDYFNDLNAMHEAEKILEDPQENGRLMATYSIWKLTEVCNAYSKGHEKSRAGSTATYWLIHATAAQRAEALGLTLNLW